MQICPAGRSPGVTESMAEAEEGQCWTRGDGLSNSFGLMSCGFRKWQEESFSNQCGIAVHFSRFADKRLCKSEV